MIGYMMPRFGANTYSYLHAMNNHLFAQLLSVSFHFTELGFVWIHPKKMGCKCMLLLHHTYC